MGKNDSARAAGAEWMPLVPLVAVASLGEDVRRMDSTCVIEKHLWNTDLMENLSLNGNFRDSSKLAKLNKQWLEPKQMEVDGSDDFLFQFG